MQLERFLTCVEECLGGGTPPHCLARDEAARTVQAVLGVLALRLSRDDRRRLEAELPRELATEMEGLPAGDEIHPASEPPGTLGRVAAALGLDEKMAARRICCVVTTLKHAVSDEAWRALPDDALALA